MPTVLQTTDKTGSDDCRQRPEPHQIKHLFDIVLYLCCVEGTGYPTADQLSLGRAARSAAIYARGGQVGERQQVHDTPGAGSGSRGEGCRKIDHAVRRHADSVAGHLRGPYSQGQRVDGDK